MLRCIKIDYIGVPESLLCAAKRQCRVEFDRDDAFIKSALGRAVGEVEAASNISVFDQIWEWDLTAGVIAPVFPKTPVRRVMVDDGTGTWVDFTNVELADPFYFGSSCLLDPFTAQVYRFEAGYSALECLPPLLVNAILLITANIYENRESIQMGSINELPDMTRRLLTGLWLPAV